MALTVNHARQPEARGRSRAGAPFVSRGARDGVLRVRLDTDHPDYNAMREEFLRIYGENLCVGRASSGDGGAPLEPRSAGIKWGVVTS